MKYRFLKRSNLSREPMAALFAMTVFLSTQIWAGSKQNAYDAESGVKENRNVYSSQNDDLKYLEATHDKLGYDENSSVDPESYKDMFRVDVLDVVCPSCKRSQFRVRITFQVVCRIGDLQVAVPMRNIAFNWKLVDSKAYSRINLKGAGYTDSQGIGRVHLVSPLKMGFPAVDVYVQGQRHRLTSDRVNFEIPYTRDNCRSNRS